MNRAARRILVRSAGVSVVVLAFASCGARTGLFVGDLDAIADASVDQVTFDGPAPFDAGRDVERDAERPVGCIPGTFPFSPATSQIMFVLDRSRSMLFRLDSNVEPPPGVTTRWTALGDALDQTITPFSSQIAMGARFFPHLQPTNDQLCEQDDEGTAIAPALDNAATILRVFRDTVPTGGTPTAGALELAARQTSSRRAVARAIVVATDGAPNCNRALDQDTCVCTAQAGTLCSGSPDGANCLDDATTVRVITQIATERNIPVYVVGIGVTGTFASTLDAMAIAGGRPRNGAPRYYPAETPAELRTAFTVVRDSVAKCTYVTPSAPTESDSIRVEVSGITIARDPKHVEGWDWIDREYGQLQLFGSACASSTTANVEGTVVCNPPDAGQDAGDASDAASNDP